MASRPHTPGGRWHERAPLSIICGSLAHTYLIRYVLSIGSAVFAGLNRVPSMLAHTDHGACDICISRLHSCDDCDAAYQHFVDIVLD